MSGLRLTVAALLLAAGTAAAQEGGELTLPAAQGDGGELPVGPAWLQIYGFADLSFRRLTLGDDDSVYRAYGTPELAFAMGHLHLYLRSNPTRRLSSLLEVRLLYLPHNAATVSGNGEVDVTSTIVADDAEIGGKLQWGALSIQRAHLDFQLGDRVTIRAGHWLTPYGIWNVDHGSPTVIGVRRPYVINTNHFPESQIGLQLFGSIPIADAELGWTATVSNGRIETAPAYDLNKAVGARLELSLPQLDELRLGASGYLGHQRTAGFRAVLDRPGDPSSARLQRTLTGELTELALGADLRLRAGRFRLLGEFVVAQRAYGDVRPAAAPPRLSGLEPDSLTYGGYAVAGFQVGPLGAMPFVMLEDLQSTGHRARNWLATLGVNLRPVPTITLKVDVSYGELENTSAPALLPDADVTVAEAQVAWVFR